MAPIHIVIFLTMGALAGSIVVDQLHRHGGIHSEAKINRFIGLLGLGLFTLSCCLITYRLATAC